MNRRQHSGQTIVSLMVGLLISLIVIVSLLALYKTLLDISGSASAVALRDGQIGSAFLAAEIELQQAGFGVDKSTNNRITLTDDKTLAWMYKKNIDDTTYLCGGLQVKSTDAVSGDADTRMKGFYRLVPVTCTTSVDADFSNANSILLASDTAFTTKASKAAGTEAGAYTLDGYTFDLTSGVSCSPYGQSTKASHYTVSFKFSGDTLFTACLSNL